MKNSENKQNLLTRCHIEQFIEKRAFEYGFDLFGISSALPHEDITYYEQLNNDLDRLIFDEERYIKIAKDSVSTFKALASRRSET